MIRTEPPSRMAARQFPRPAARQESPVVTADTPHVAAAAGVFLVARAEIVRRGLRRILLEDGRFPVAGEAAAADDALPAIAAAQPDLCVVEDRAGVGDGIALCGRVLEALPTARVVVVTAEDSQQQVIDAVAAGASGVLLGNVTAEQLLHTLGEVALGRAMVDPALTGSVLDYFRLRCAPDAAAGTALSPSELALIGFVSDGMSNHQIAAQLRVPIATVKGRLSALMRKLGVSTRTQIALHGARLLDGAPRPAGGERPVATSAAASVGS